MKRHKMQERLSIGLLVCIALSMQKMVIFNIEISVVSLLLLFTAYYFVAKEQGKLQIYLLITSLILLLAYVTFLLFALYDPVWVIFPKNLMAATVLAYLTIILHEPFHLRIIALTIGMVQGDILYSMIVGKLLSKVTIGTFEFFDMFSLTIAFVCIVSGLKKVAFIFENHLQQIEKEKQKHYE